MKFGSTTRATLYWGVSSVNDSATCPIDDSASNQEYLSSVERVAKSFTDETPQHNIARVLDSNYTQSQEQYPPATHCSPNQDENPNLIPEFQAKPRRDTNPYVNPNVPTSHQGTSATQTTQVPFLGLTPV